MSAERTEVSSRLKRQDRTLCLPLGELLEEVLERAGFQPEQEVVVRSGRDRLEILPRNTPQETREKLKATAEELKEIEARMRNLLEGLPAVSDEELESGETLEAELQGLLECLLADDLAPAIQKLESVNTIGAPGSSGPRSA